MYKKLDKLHAYTLVELLIVIILIAVVVVFAIPVFSAYGKNQAFNQKIDEVKLLMDQAYLLSKNPEKNVLAYEVVTDSNKLVLKRCFQVTGSEKRCSGNSGEFAVVKEVPLLASQAFQNPGSAYITCLAEPNATCTTHATDKFSFIDSGLSDQNTVVFTLNNPFSISFEKIDS